MRTQLHKLELVYPPITNQESEWLKTDKDVEKQVSESKLYFIAQRPQSHFDFPSNVKSEITNNYKIPFSYHLGNEKAAGIIDIKILLKTYGFPEDIGHDIELGPNLIRLITENHEIIDWITTNKLVYDVSRKKPYITITESFPDFSTYQLHYVGISKTEDSFKRLVKKSHHNRQNILSNESSLKFGARLTDELIFFFFRIKSAEIQTLTDFNEEELSKNELEDKIRIVADAEKAFVKILDTKYNKVKFKNYPFSEDGLYDTSVLRHAYCIDEDITFITNQNTLNGKRSDFLGEGSDFIAVNKNEVEFVKVSNITL